MVNQHYIGPSGNNSSEQSPTTPSFPSPHAGHDMTRSVAAASEYSPGSGVPKPVRINAKPASKSSLGSVTVKFHPPGFQTFQVEVTVNGKPIQSQKLRRKAIESFVKQTFPEVGTSFAINTRAEMDVVTDKQTNIKVPVSIVDHIIFPFRNGAQKRRIKSCVGGKSDVVSDLKKKPKRGTDGNEEDIHCRISESVISDREFNDLKVKNLKARNMDILLRILASSKMSGTQHAPLELQDLPKAPSNRVDVAMISNPKLPEQKSSTDYIVQIRSQMSIDFINSALRFDYDLVSIIPVISLAELVKDVLGSDPAVKDGTFIVPDRKEKTKVDHLPMLKHMLCGLKVHCGYKPDSKLGADLLDANTSSDGRCFQIKDVKFPDGETEFTAADGTLYNIAGYFNTVVLKGMNKQLDYADWPVVKDNTGVWILLEMLYVAPGQVLTRCGKLTEELMYMARKYMKNAGEYQLLQHSQGIFQMLASTRVGKAYIATNWMEDHALVKTQFVPNPDLFPDRKSSDLQQHAVLNVGLLKIVPTKEDDVESSFFDALQSGLQSKYHIQDYTCTANDVLENGKSVSDLLGSAHPHKLILAVTSKSFQGMKSDPAVAQLPKIFARLRSLCELEDGIMLVCQTGTSLVELYKDSEGPKDYFTKGVQRRIDFMLGKPNFITNALDPLPPAFRERFIIIGANIMHKSLLGQKKKPKYVPSISAVVASMNGDALNFPGSARFQRTTEKITASRRVPQHYIPGLPNMLVERLQAWAYQHTPPQYVLFYRDSVGFDQDVAREECQMIRDAFWHHFGLLPIPLITYIVVNKNAKLEYLSHGPDAPLAQLSGDFVIEHGKAKYRYYVVCNEIKLSLRHLEDMTRKLNDSNQLYPQLNQVAKALPLTWAAKLCERVHGYVASVKPEDLPLPEIERPKKPSQKEIDDEDQAIVEVKKYLKLDDPTARSLPWKKELDYRMFYL